ncbi:Zinc finger and BTB domain-containing protein 24 [Orchesella cincta]|uniref:Zinc finger and BTB domain-containing protein 24 n=1 Tax=Orchesella cincta TaxID=48709 RepID=A0A1D2N609_ORCCI|nr:Zinc finger and BTB domain-containing protein 24 [Orchesella cincta]
MEEDHLPKFTLVSYSSSNNDSKNNDTFDEEESDLVSFEVHEIEGEELQEVDNEEDAELSKVHNNAFSAFALSACPECDISTCLRPVQECCGHVKCRRCFLTNEEGCKQCVDESVVEQNDEGCEQLEGQGIKKQEVLEYSYNINTDGDEMETIVPSANEYILELEQASGDKSIALVSSETLKQLGINHENVNLDCSQITTSISESQTGLGGNDDEESAESPTPDSTAYETTEALADQEHQPRRKQINSGKPKIADHIVILSTKPRRYHCTECDQEFTQEYRRQFHLYCNPQNGNRPFTCNLCPNEFTSRSHYEYHVKSKHTHEKPFRCTICAYQFITKKKLERHMNSHSDNPLVIRTKFYLCAYCKKRFNNLSNCKKHLRTHTDEKPFECAVCKKAFGQKTTLDVHMRIHEGHRPYKCPEPGCDRAFSTNKDCRRHHLCHGNDKPFLCSLCMQCFRRKDNLERHLRNTHNLEEDLVKMISKKAAEKYQNSNNVKQSEKKSSKRSASNATTKIVSVSSTEEIIHSDVITGL